MYLATWDVHDDFTCLNLPLIREDYLSKAKFYYQHLFDLSTNSLIDENLLVSNDTRNMELDVAPVYLKQGSGANSPVFTERGWFMLHKGETFNQITSDDIAFDNSHQFTIEFEVFPLLPTFEIILQPQESSIGFAVSQII